MQTLCILSRKLSNCFSDVKCTLFNSFRSNMYCSTMRYNCTMTAMRRLGIAYNNSLRRLLGIPKHNSASGMFVQLNINSFGELMRSYIHSFMNRLQCSNNLILSVLIYLVKVLCYWYQHQSMYVKWGSTLSSKFQVTNGVRQGGVLSPLLFNVYVNALSELLNKSGTGGNMDGTIINHMLYADDICIVSLSSSGLQKLLNICHDYCELHDLTFNAKYLCVCILVLI